MRYYSWARRGGFECSTKGDSRFSAFNAILPNGDSIEKAYQCGVKGYSTIRSGKGRPPLNPVKNLFGAYLKLWEAYFEHNPFLLEEAKQLVKPYGNVFSDCFANTNVNQARAIATILNNKITDVRKYHYHVDGTRPAHSIFVFGSNMSGIHGAGSAKLAADEYGAIFGEPSGLQDCSYAIPTVDYLERGAIKQPPLDLETIRENVQQFIRVAITHNAQREPLRFFVTRIGCGLAGYKDSEIAPMFKNAPINCSFAEQWMTWLEP